jgi:hypothetical protein
LLNSTRVFPSITSTLRPKRYFPNPAKPDRHVKRTSRNRLITSRLSLNQLVSSPSQQFLHNGWPSSQR